MYKQSVTAVWPQSADFTGTVTNSSSHTINALPSVGVYVRTSCSELAKIQIFRVFNDLVDTVPYREFMLDGTKTISLPPGKYLEVITKDSANVDAEIWVALSQFSLTEV